MHTSTINPMFNPHQMALLRAGKAAGTSSFDVLVEAQLPTNEYTCFLYDECWLENPATLDKIAQGFRVSQSGEVAIGPYYHSLLAQRLPITRALIAQGVPFIVEFSDYLLKIERRNCSRPLDWLAFLTRQIHLAASEDIDYFFAEIANTLQNQLVIATESAMFRLNEIEFYYHGRNHPDPYVHKGAEQLKHLHWYFNQAGGLDLTFGDPDTGSYGGILLRGIQQLNTAGGIPAETDAYTLGPQLTMRALVASWGSAIKGAACLGLQQTPLPFQPSATPWRTARVGLVVRPDMEDQTAPFISRPYRFLVDEGYLARLTGKEKICQELGLAPAVVLRVLGYKPKWL